MCTGFTSKKMTEAELLKRCAQQILEKEVDPNLRLFLLQLWKMIHMFSFL